ncbi:MAG: 50S ribosomal protein L13 [Nanoarchaeota archaeon]
MDRNEIVINAENARLGRLATYVAKQALQGHKVIVYNCEKAIVVGNKDNIIERYKTKRDRGSTEKGPFFPKKPERVVRRAIRGMLPYDRTRGREAFRRVKCYVGSVEKDGIKFNLEVKGKYLTIAELCNFM